MNLEAVGHIGEAVGAAAVVVSLVYLMIQLRQNTRSIRSATYQSVVETAAACNRTIAGDKSLARIMRLAASDASQLDEDERMQFTFLCIQFFDIFENLYLQHLHGTLDDDYWTSRRGSFSGLLASPGFSDRWKSARHSYSSRFREFVEAELASVLPDRHADAGFLFRLGDSSDTPTA